MVKTGAGGYKKRDNRQEKAREEGALTEKVINIRRVAKVVKGGRRFSFSAFVVAGNGKGSAGFGFGKANEVPNAINKALTTAKKSFVAIQLQGTTIPHELEGKFKGAKVLLRPALTDDFSGR